MGPGRPEQPVDIRASGYVLFRGVIKIGAMNDPTVEALIVDFLSWLARGERSYEEVMEAWRTSCPKLPVWEEANDRGLVTRDRAQDRSMVRITEAGLAYLAEKGIVAQR